MLSHVLTHSSAASSKPCESSPFLPSRPTHLPSCPEVCHHWGQAWDLACSSSCRLRYSVLVQGGSLCPQSVPVLSSQLWLAPLITSATSVLTGAPLALVISTGEAFRAYIIPLHPAGFVQTLSPGHTSTPWYLSETDLILAHPCATPALPHTPAADRA